MSAPDPGAPKTESCPDLRCAYSKGHSGPHSYER